MLHFILAALPALAEPPARPAGGADGSAVLAGDRRSPLAGEGGALHFPACVKRRKAAFQEPKDFEALMDCQWSKRAEFIRWVKETRRRGPTAEEFDLFGDFQRKEVRDYLKRRPAAAQTEEKPRTEEPSQEASLAKLKEFMEQKSDGGKKGITPEIAQALTDYLKERQGGVSPEMRSLLKDLGEDGVRLRHKTMYKLKRAARDARSAGVDFQGIDPALVDWLSDPATDPDPNEPGPDYDKFEPPSM